MKKIQKYICIHGHFYQPYRMNPWLEKIQFQENAKPYHDWNERITAECYDTNSASHILDSNNKIKDISNNYSKISFNFGPTLLSWIKSSHPDLLARIIDADHEGMGRFSGHGTAMAQTYNHLIMPLANKKDKYIQVSWSVKDFKKTFNRQPEGMWIAEIAVDNETLDLLAQFGIKFVILSPDQASRIRKINDNTDGWKMINESTLNTRMPYICKLPSGKSIIIFFYDANISNKISFGNLLSNGKIFADSLISEFSTSLREPEIIVIASDGETYGHHHRFGDMALAYCLEYIESNNLAKITIPGEYIEINPPTYEVEIIENTSWSCKHSICRWKEDCGCASGDEPHPEWNQKWRKPLREAVDWLSAKLTGIMEMKLAGFIKKDFLDPWVAVDNYIDTINDRSAANIQNFLDRFFDKQQLNTGEMKVFELLEMYRHSLLMQSSDGWFFDEISRMESIQILKSACRAIELASHFNDENLESGFLNILKNANSNIDKYRNAAFMYESIVKKSMYDFEKVCAELAADCLFIEEIEADQYKNLYCFEVSNLSFEKIENEKLVLCMGKAALKSEMTFEQNNMIFFTIYIKNPVVLEKKINLYTKKVSTEEEMTKAKLIFDNIDKFIKENSNSRVFEVINSNPGEYSYYTITDLSVDKQNEITKKIFLMSTGHLESDMAEIQNEFKIDKDNYLQSLDNNIFINKILIKIYSLVINTKLYILLKNEDFEDNYFAEFEKLSEEIMQYRIAAKTEGSGILLDTGTFDQLATAKIDIIMRKFENEPENLSMLRNIIS
ncbi:MAG: DUF3536 domain-containing protein, partial [Actinobacteria bacterium]|nr:DUF3536 domain-containing protein [Actinomycetota bacterium]